MGFSPNQGYLFGGPYNKDSTILGVYIGVPLFWETTISCRTLSRDLLLQLRGMSGMSEGPSRECRAVLHDGLGGPPNPSIVSIRYTATRFKVLSYSQYATITGLGEVS